MASLLERPDSVPESEETRFTAAADLRHDNRLGESRLVVTDRRAYRLESTPLGEDLLVSYELSELKNPRVEDLVDASALVADHQGSSVELIRATNKRSLIVAGAEKRLSALLKGEPMPELEDQVRICPKCARPLPEHSDVCEGCVNRGKTLLRLFEYTHPFKSRLIWQTICTLGGTALELIPPYLTMHLVDDVLRHGAQASFVPLILGMVAAQAAITVVRMARGRNVAYLGMQITISIRHSLFEKLQALSLSFYDKRNVGSIMSRMTNDTTALYDVLVDGIPVVLNQIALLIGIPIMLLVINWQVAVWAILPLPFVFMAVRWFRRRMHRVWSRVHHQWSRMSGTLNGILQGTRVVKAFHGENREVARFNRRIADLANSGYDAEASWATFFPFVTFTMALSTIVVWYVGGRGVLSGVMTIGELMAFLAYVGRLEGPLMMLQRIIDWSTRALTAAERVFEVMDTPIDIEEAPDAVAIPKVKGGVKFEDVHFGYDKAREVLHGIDLDVLPGEMIGLVGHSGAGKSTLINLLMRFYDPTQGTISIDGIDLRKVKLDDFRRQVGVVLQESYLFPGTVRDNIAYGRPTASLEEVLAAAKAANAHDFIVNFPDGYDTYVGERGQRLSGGERQRIAIARAILHNPKVLILDEATASVDTETERQIQEALENLVEGRTVFAIAHRLSTLRNADRLVVIDDGRVAEVGTHEELLAKDDGIYKKLVDMQMEVNKIKSNYLVEE
ncbi:ABC transporter ATP-binding protein [Fimbriimonas ginsengisoli]|nr:ABC transporter ATP-binding protein [Fimbriimonas ginsengisoli]